MSSDQMALDETWYGIAHPIMKSDLFRFVEFRLCATGNGLKKSKKELSVKNI